MMIGDGNDEGSGASSGAPDGGNVIIGGGRSFERSVLTKRGAGELDFDDDSGMRTIGAGASDLLATEELLDRRVLLLLLLRLDRTGDLDLLLERRRRDGDLSRFLSTAGDGDLD